MGESCVICPGSAYCNPQGDKYVYDNSTKFFYCAGNGVERIGISFVLLLLISAFSLLM
jgi:hypothetical protein